MSFCVCEVHSRREELSRSDALIADARAALRPVHVIAPDAEWQAQRKRMLAAAGSLGVSVELHDQFLADVWSVHGDGRALVTAQRRRLLLRPLLDDAGLLEAEASSALLGSCAAFVQEAIVSQAVMGACLTETQETVMRLVSRYAESLREHGLIEPAQAEEQLDGAVFDGLAVIVEEPPRACVHERRFLERIGGHADVVVFDEALPSAQDEPLGHDELALLRARLYTGLGGLEAHGAVRVGEAYGAHATPQLAVNMVQELHAAGAAYEDIVLVAGRDEDVHPHLVEALALAHVPFATSFAVPLAQTGLGNAFVCLARFSCEADDEEAYEALSDFVLGPYSGLDVRDARALQARWRNAGHSNAQERMRDVREGFCAGQANSRVVRERLQPLVRVLEADDETRVRLLFDNAKHAGLDADALLDDRAAAEAVLDVLEDAHALGVAWHVRDIAAIPVTLQRSSGPAERALRVRGSCPCTISPVPYLVLGDLDAGHYPTAAVPDVFDGLRALLGLAVADDTALTQRLLLANMLEACTCGFGFYRSRHNTSGEESCESALFDELLAPYRSERDERAGLPAAELPAALAPHAVRLSEAELFFGGDEAAGEAPDAPAVAVQRGVLADERAVALLCAHDGGGAREFSPTQLEDYHRCPYLWFSSRRVGYNALDRELDKSALGTLFHDTMARFYQLLGEAGHARVTPENLPAALELAQHAFSAQLEESKRKPRKGVLVRTHADAMDIEATGEMVLAFVERDASFAPGFVPTYFEVGLASREHTLEYATVPVRGAVDRIDVDAAGRALVIDYKSNSLKQGFGLPAHLERDDVNVHVQTDIYARLVEKHFALQGVTLQVVGSVYRSYSCNMLRGVYDAGVDFGENEQTRPACDALPREGFDASYAAYVQRVERVITADVERLASGYIEPDPIDSSVCRYCKARGFCPKAQVTSWR